MNQEVGVMGFLIFMLVGISTISIHYRRKYEQLKHLVISVRGRIDLSLSNENKTI